MFLASDNNNTSDSGQWMSGQTVVITGCTHGLGLSVMHSLISRGARVCAVNRNHVLAEQVRFKLGQTFGEDALNRMILYHCDLASLPSVVNCAKAILASEPRIHVLINNAATIFSDFQCSATGHEMQFQVNQLGPFLLTLLLLERIEESRPSRIVVVSSLAYKYAKAKFDPALCFKKMALNYSPFRAYKYTKLANLYWGLALAQRLGENCGIDVHIVHPGAVKTNLGSDVLAESHFCLRGLLCFFRAMCMISPESGAVAILRCACDPSLKGVSGHFYTINGREMALTRSVRNAAGLLSKISSYCDKDTADDMRNIIWNFCENACSDFLPKDSV